MNQTNLIIFGAKYLFLLSIIIIFLYFALAPRARQKNIIALSVVYLPLTYVIAKITSFFYFDPRPFVVGHFQPLIAHTADNGFPSDHMLLCSALASIIFVYNKKLGVLAWIIAFLIGFARVSAGIHHWADIVGSVLIAILMMVVMVKFIMPRLVKTKLYQNF